MVKAGNGMFSTGEDALALGYVVGLAIAFFALAFALWIVKFWKR